MLLLLLVLYDPVLLFSYLIYYIIYIVGYDAGGYIVGGVAGVIYYLVAGVDSSAIMDLLELVLLVGIIGVI